METHNIILTAVGALGLAGALYRLRRTLRGEDKDQIQMKETMGLFESELRGTPESSKLHVYKVLAKFRDACYAVPDATVMGMGENIDRNLPQEYQYKKGLDSKI